MIEELETLQRSAVDMLRCAADATKAQDWEWAAEYTSAAGVVLKALESVRRANSRLTRIDGIRRG